MSQNKSTDLVSQIKSENPKDRRKAYKQLAASGDPKVIPYLRNAYLSDDDDQVRDLAYDALAAFKAMQQGQTSRRLPISDEMLKKIAGGLAVVFVISLLLNGVMMLAGGGDDGESSTPTAVAQLAPTDRDVLVTRMQDRLTAATTFAAALRTGIDQYNADGTLKCDLNQPVPQVVDLAPIDRSTYRDLDLVGTKLDAAIANIDIAQFQWQHSCSLPAPDINDVLGASASLDQAQIQLEEITGLLQNAIDHPAPTTAPSPTPDPLVATNTPSAEDAQPAMTEEPTANAEPTATPEPTASPTPSVTLPFPEDLDYSSILSALSRQSIVLADLENQYDTGMINRWQRAQSTEGPSSTSGCVLSPWPDPFEFTPEQRAQLDRPDVADPQLEQAVALLQEGRTAADQARTLYERDCPTGNLAASAAEGIPLAQGAYDRMQGAADLIDIIRQRP